MFINRLTSELSPRIQETRFEPYHHFIFQFKTRQLDHRMIRLLAASEAEQDSKTRLEQITSMCLLLTCVFSLIENPKLFD